MKKILLFIAVSVLVLTSIHAQEQKPLKLKGVIVDNHYHDGYSTIWSKPIPLEQKSFENSATIVSHMRIGFNMRVIDGKQHISNLFILNEYKADNWVFFDEISYLFGSKKEVKYGKGVVFKYDGGDTITDVKNHGIVETSISRGNEEIIKYILTHDTGLNIRYKNTRDRKSRSIQVPGGTKKFKKRFQKLIDAYNAVNKHYKLDARF